MTNIDTIREFKLSPERRAACRIANRAFRARNIESIREKQRLAKRKAVRVPENEHARHILRNAVASGEIVKPDTCSDCGIQMDVSKIQSHHEDYSKPLDVLWLCSACHGRRHRID